MRLPAPLFAAALSLAALALLGSAHGAKAGAIEIGRAWARATAPGQPAGGNFLQLSNGGQSDRLLGASAAVAERVEMHSMTMEGDVMRMRQVDSIDLPAGQTVKLEPGGYHLMLLGLRQPLKAGSTFPLKLRFQKAGEVTVDVKIESATALPQKDSPAH